MARMPDRKPRPPKDADDPEQSRRFIDMAQELGAAERAEDADQILRKVANKKKHDVKSQSPKNG